MKRVLGERGWIFPVLAFLLALALGILVERQRLGEGASRGGQVALWATGWAVALLAAVALPLLRRTIATQREELRRRLAAEEEARDLTMQVEAARARASRDALRFAAVLDQMADGVVVVDAEGTIQLSNVAAEELLGTGIRNVPLSDWLRHLRLATVDGRRYPTSEFPLSRALRGERVRRASFILRSSGSDERYLSASASPINGPSGEARGAAMLFRDVTDEHQYAEMLLHTNREIRHQAEALEHVNRQLREATAAKDQFLAVMSHELRTPINAIMGYTDLLDLGVKGALNEEQRTMLARVRDTSRHLLGLINEVLDLAKVGAGQIDLRLREANVGEIIDRSVLQVLPLATKKGLPLTVEGGLSPDGEPITALVDETRLAQIVVNLLSNAVKFTDTGGVLVRYARPGELVEIRVKDTGPGIAPDQQERIFEEFYQIEAGFTRSTGGTGLGLAIARKFARLMGGDIRVESRVGLGAEFIVEIPVCGAEPPGKGAAQQRAIATSREAS